MVVSVQRTFQIAKEFESFEKVHLIVCNVRNVSLTETDLAKDQATRLYFIKCNACGASRSVVASDWFQAMKRGEKEGA